MENERENTVIRDAVQITIKRIRTIEYPTTKEQLIEERHYTDRELEENHRWMIDKDRAEFRKKVYGSVDCLSTEKVEMQLLEQSIDFKDFKLTQVIKAINNI